MKKKKVYLAKSNHANPNELIILRKQLNDLGVEVVEYEGGQYSNKSMLECEYLIVLPADAKRVWELEEEITTEYSHDTGIRMLGKGLYTQISDFCNFTRYSDNIYIVFDNSMINNVGSPQTTKFHCAKHEDLEIYDENDYHNYGYSILSNEADTTITELFGGNKVQSSNQYMYLLAKR